VNSKGIRGRDDFIVKRAGTLLNFCIDFEKPMLRRWRSAFGRRAQRGGA